jgi:hypothetical protein
MLLGLVAASMAFSWDAVRVVSLDLPGASHMLLGLVLTALLWCSLMSIDLPGAVEVSHTQL